MAWSEQAILSSSIAGLPGLPDWVDSDRYDSYQRPLVDEIVERFREGMQLVVLSCPTGGGKTAIAEAVRQTLNLRGLYLCSSLQLMDQFLADFPYAKLIAGKRNYTPTHPTSDDIRCDDCTYDKDTDYCDYCKPAEDCPYRIARALAIRSRLTCSNTSYFLRACEASGSWMSKRPLIVLDEADRIEDELLGNVSISLSPYLQRRIGLVPPEKKTKVESWQEWFKYALPFVSDCIEEADDSVIEGARLKRSLERNLELMKKVSDDVENYVYTGYDQSRIEFRPIVANGIGPSALWGNGTQFLAMSATIGSPEAFVESLGFEGSYASVFAPSCFDPQRRPVHFFPAARMSKKNQDTEWPKMGDALLAVLNRHPDERILVHTHSYRLTSALYDHTLDYAINEDRSIFAYLNPRDRNSAIASFEETPGAVLLAPSLERGYNGKDELVRVVVLAKTPYPNLGDKVVSARLYSSGGRLWFAAKTADAICQAFGRGMRHEGDHMVGYILDAQFSVLFSDWKAGWDDDGKERHLLFAPHFVEALHRDSEEVFELRQSIKTLNSSPS